MFFLPISLDVRVIIRWLLFVCHCGSAVGHTNNKANRDRKTEWNWVMYEERNKGRGKAAKETENQVASYTDLWFIMGQGARESSELI